MYFFLALFVVFCYCKIWALLAMTTDRPTRCIRKEIPVRRCPKCGRDPVIYEQPPETYNIACGHCGAGPKDQFDSYDYQSGKILERWDSWVRRKQARRRRKEE
jgi:hypothetical protein